MFHFLMLIDSENIMINGLKTIDMQLVTVIRLCGSSDNTHSGLGNHNPQLYNQRLENKVRKGISSETRNESLLKWFA